jgi:hypothetical protein
MNLNNVLYTCILILWTNIMFIILYLYTTSFHQKEFNFLLKCLYQAKKVHIRPSCIGDIEIFLFLRLWYFSFVFLSLFLYLYNKVELNPFRVNADDDKSKLILLCHSLIEISIHFVKTLWYQNSLYYANQRGPIGIHLFLQKLQ